MRACLSQCIPVLCCCCTCVSVSVPTVASAGLNVISRLGAIGRRLHRHRLIITDVRAVLLTLLSTILIFIVSDSATHFQHTWLMWPTLLKYQLETLTEGSSFIIGLIFGRVPIQKFILETLGTLNVFFLTMFCPPDVRSCRKNTCCQQHKPPNIYHMYAKKIVNRYWLIRFWAIFGDYWGPDSIAKLPIFKIWVF